MSEWTKDVPTEPGLYWIRSIGGKLALAVLRKGTWTATVRGFTWKDVEAFEFDFGAGEELFGVFEFWPERIEPPSAT